MLVVVAHPDLSESVVNRALLARAETIDGVEVFDLYGAYPNFEIDVETEQQRLRARHRVVLQHPMYWYSSPALLKHWIDKIITPGFAYAGGRELRGVELGSAVTCAAPASAYSSSGWNRYTVDEFLRPFEATAQFCRMVYLEPFVVHGARDGLDLEAAADHYETWLRAPAASSIS